MPYGTIQADKIQGSINSFSPDSSFFRNRIINGAMMIDQRNAGASVNARDNVFPVDRFKFRMAVNDRATGQQSSVAPAGFINSLLITSSAATTPGASDDYSLQHPIEGLNVADLGWGTASAQTVTLSFWVRSSLTGQFGGALKNSANNRSYPYSYTISSANTWEFKSITIAGDTSGTWLTTNGVGINVLFDLGSGSSVIGTAGSWSGSSLFGATGDTKLISTNGATFYITGVQLEEGNTATSFGFRPYGTELALCQRYFQTLGGGSKGSEYGLGCSGVAISTTAALGSFLCSPQMRSTPTASVSGTLIARFFNGSSSFTSLAEQYIDAAGGYINVTVSGATNGSGVIFRSEGTNNGRILLSAEL